MTIYNSAIKLLPTAADAPDQGVDLQNVTLFLDASDGNNAYIRRQTGVDAAGLPIFANDPLTVPGAFSFIGSLNPAGGMGSNINYPAGSIGNAWWFISAGTIGAPPVPVEVGEILVCINNSAGGAGAGADFIVQQVNLVQATETQEGFLRFATDAEIQAGTSTILGVSAETMFARFQTDGTPNIKSTLFEPNAEGDSLEAKSTDMTIPGNSGRANFGSGRAADAAVNASNSGDVNINSGDGGDKTAIGMGNAGASGDIYIEAGQPGTDAGGGMLGAAGNVLIKAGSNGFMGDGVLAIGSQTTISDGIYSLGGGSGVILDVLGVTGGFRVPTMTTVDIAAMVVAQGGTLPEGTQVYDTTLHQQLINKVAPPGAVVWSIMA